MPHSFAVATSLPFEQGQRHICLSIPIPARFLATSASHAEQISARAAARVLTAWQPVPSLLLQVCLRHDEVICAEVKAAGSEVANPLCMTEAVCLT